MDYRTIKSLSDEIRLFQTILELGPFDDTDPKEVAEVLEHLNSTPYCGSGRIHAADPKSVIDVSNDLIAWGVLERLDGEVRMTQSGRDWGRVLQISIDGTYKVFGSAVDEHAWPTFIAALYSFINELDALRKSLERFLGDHTSPDRLCTLMRAAVALAELPRLPEYPIPLETYREAAVLACREAALHRRERKEKLEILARDRRVLDGTEREIGHLESILNIPGLASALTAHKPRVTDFVNVGVVEEQTVGRPMDEKFGILSAPSLFSEDYPKTAEDAFSRNRSFAVGFIDIDKFKDFNSKHTETVVDRVILPQFMRALEAYCHGRAYAYRQGGDEYLVLLHNATPQEARVFFEGLQADIAKIDYPDVDPNLIKPTVSIGVHVIDGASEVTVFEAKKLANQAKDVAKKAGRSCVRFSAHSMLFTTDYAEIANAALSRDRSFAVGFIDIDKFKDFNTTHTQTVVDQDMLPYFMRALDAYCYGRAIAYRQGGDEYLVLLRNANPDESRSFFEGLQAHIAEIEYPESIQTKPTVSIGVHVIDGNSEGTVLEAKKLANQAKDAAKDDGRNCVRLSTDTDPSATPLDSQEPPQS